MMRLSFNSRTRVGCDQINRRRLIYIYMFQFTHPCGVRRRTFCTSTSLPSFNSRTRVGCDIYSGEPVDVPKVSIHAPVWGATP